MQYPDVIKKGEAHYEALLKAAKSDVFNWGGTVWKRIPDNSDYIFVQDSRLSTMDTAYSTTIHR